MKFLTAIALFQLIIGYSIVSAGDFESVNEGEEARKLEPICNNPGNWNRVGNPIQGGVDGTNSVSISSDGKIVAIGYPERSSDDKTYGIVRVFRKSDDSSQWINIGGDIEADEYSDNFGYSVSLSSDGRTVAVGAPGLGYVKVFQLYEIMDSVWKQAGTTINADSGDEQFGHSVSLSSDGTTIFIGAPVASKTGKVVAYHLFSDWVKIGSEVQGIEDYEKSGQSTSISSDGTIMAIGAPKNNGNGQPNSGAVRVFRLTRDANWLQVGGDIIGENANDRSGVSVSLSSDGLTVAIGANFNDGNDQNAGHVRIYSYDGAEWIQIGYDIDGE